MHFQLHFLYAAEAVPFCKQAILLLNHKTGLSLTTFVMQNRTFIYKIAQQTIIPWCHFKRFMKKKTTILFDFSTIVFFQKNFFTYQRIFVMLRIQ